MLRRLSAMVLATPRSTALSLGAGLEGRPMALRGEMKEARAEKRPVSIFIELVNEAANTGPITPV
ncbi:MAG: hypothetical protein HY303_01705 [Candidatus Wallbacteria bacterium]|nr:hypothetical protein [Candidatus Wallbacteria bacterium]